MPLKEVSRAGVKRQIALIETKNEAEVENVIEAVLENNASIRLP